MTLVLDHLAVAAETLGQGVEYIEDFLGVKTAPGGKHALMSTHNHLLSLGPSTYLEVIAIDPDAPPPGRARWFDLDGFSGAPRLTNWIARTDDLAAAKQITPPGIGEELALSRGNLNWRMLVPDTGKLPFDGAYPALIAWDCAAHPAQILPDQGCRMAGLRIGHPNADRLCRLLAPLMDLSGVVIEPAEGVSISAEIQTPTGIVHLK